MRSRRVILFAVSENKPFVTKLHPNMVYSLPISSPECYEGKRHCAILSSLSHWSLQMESAVTAPVSGHIKRVVVNEGAWVLCLLKLMRNRGY